MNKRNEILEFIKRLNGRFFTVEFIKKDNTIRKMNCRTGVKKYLSSNGKKVKLTPPKENGILRVYEPNKAQYRSINIDTVKRISFNGITLKYK